MMQDVYEVAEWRRWASHTANSPPPSRYLHHQADRRPHQTAARSIEHLQNMKILDYFWIERLGPCQDMLCMWKASIPNLWHDWISSTQGLGRFHCSRELYVFNSAMTVDRYNGVACRPANSEVRELGAVQYAFRSRLLVPMDAIGRQWGRKFPQP